MNFISQRNSAGDGDGRSGVGRQFHLRDSVFQRHVRRGLRPSKVLCERHDCAVGHRIAAAVSHRTRLQLDLISSGLGGHRQPAWDCPEPAPRPGCWKRRPPGLRTWRSLLSCPSPFPSSPRPGSTVTVRCCAAPLGVDSLKETGVGLVIRLW